MISDLQGSDKLLTDPVIHSKDRLFDQQGDNGKSGMMVFFRKHKCNNYCTKLGLKPHQGQNNEIKPYYKAVEFNAERKYIKCQMFYCNENTEEKDTLCKSCQAKKIDLTKLFC